MLLSLLINNSQVGAIIYRLPLFLRHMHTGEVQQVECIHPELRTVSFPAT